MIDATYGPANQCATLYWKNTLYFRSKIFGGVAFALPACNSVAFTEVVHSHPVYIVAEADLMPCSKSNFTFQILIDTKDVQKDINQLSGKLDRTFTVTDELIFRVSSCVIYRLYKCLTGKFTNHNKIAIPRGPTHKCLWRGVRQRFIFYTQKNHNFRICLPKKITTFFKHTQKKSLSSFFATQKIPSFFFSRPKKIPVSFIDPQKSPLAKISDPKKITRTPPPLPSLKYVSGAPG